MKNYRIHILTKTGRAIISDPLMTEGKMNHEEIVQVLDNIVEGVAQGGYLTMNVQGTRKAYLHNGIESIFWTHGS